MLCKVKQGLELHVDMLSSIAMSEDPYALPQQHSSTSSSTPASSPPKADFYQLMLAHRTTQPAQPAVADKLNQHQTAAQDQLLAALLLSNSPAKTGPSAVRATIPTTQQHKVNQNQPILHIVTISCTPTQPQVSISHSESKYT